MHRLALAVLLIAACGKNQSPPPPSSGSPNAKPESAPPAHSGGQQPDNDAPSEAEVMYGQVCAACHGMSGMGDGPGAATLNPKPRNYTDAAWQASITDAQIKEIIVKGGQGVGKSAMMPAQAQLANKPEVLDGLVKIIRGFKK